MLLENMFTDDNLVWMDGQGHDNDIVLSSQVRLARNFKEIPFPNRASVTQLTEAKMRILNITSDFSNITKKNYTSIDMDKLTNLQKNVLVEKHIISSNFLKNTEARTLIISINSDIAIMLNEDDHLRIQCMQSGLDIKKALEKAFIIDDAVEKKYDMAFDDAMGYLTACPTNLGTGLRASVILHLPGLVATNQVGKIINVSPQLGLAVRGLFGNTAHGHLFQISNQLSLGFEENELVDNLTHTVEEIVSHEREARKALLSYAEEKVCDQAWRALGVLKYARSLSDKELLQLASSVRLGIDEKIITGINENVFNKLIIAGRTNYLTNLQDKESMSQREVDKIRADVTRRIIASSSLKE